MTFSSWYTKPSNSAPTRPRKPATRVRPQRRGRAVPWVTAHAPIDPNGQTLGHTWRCRVVGSSRLRSDRSEMARWVLNSLATVQLVVLRRRRHGAAHRRLRAGGAAALPTARRNRVRACLESLRVVFQADLLLVFQRNRLAPVRRSAVSMPAVGTSSLRTGALFSKASLISRLLVGEVRVLRMPNPAVALSPWATEQRISPRWAHGPFERTGAA
jgi:hypothetical protein